MIDSSDGDFALLAVGGPLGLVLAIVLWYVACQNAKECAEMQCPKGGQAELVAHDCRCLDKPLPKGVAADGGP